VESSAGSLYYGFVPHFTTVCHTVGVGFHMAIDSIIILMMMITRYQSRDFVYIGSTKDCHLADCAQEDLWACANPESKQGTVDFRVHHPMPEPYP
jgi:hypothetical protein